MHVPVTEAKGQLTELVRRAEAGDEVILTRHGHAAVRAYWERQFETTDPRVEPQQITPVGDEQVVVDVHQVVRDTSGNVLADRMVQHVYVLRDDLVERMDVRED